MFIILYCCDQFTDDFEHSDIFKLGSVDHLLTEIKKKLNLHLDSRNVKEGMAAHEILEQDMYGSGLGCDVSNF